MAKKKSLQSKMGRPVKGPLSTYPNILSKRIRKLRRLGAGWGPDKLLVELIERYNYSKSELPGRASLARFLKEEGFVKSKSTKSDMPMPRPLAVNTVHDLWELDAHGATEVNGNFVSMINIKDVRSKAHCGALPVIVRNTSTQPKTADYQWALRFAFEEFGLPRQIQVDKDSVFMDNQSRSPFPSRFHLWLIAIGIELIFITSPPPQQQASVERSHQTIDGWVFCQKGLLNWQQLWRETKRNQRQYNEKFPVRTLQRQAPLVAFPDAKHNKRTYSIDTEYKIWSSSGVNAYLASGQWFRKVASNQTVSLGGQVYYLAKAFAGQEVIISYLMEEGKFIIKDRVNNLQWKVTPKGLLAIDLIGETQNEIIKIHKAFKSKIDYPLSTT